MKLTYALWGIVTAIAVSACNPDSKTTAAINGFVEQVVELKIQDNHTAVGSVSFVRDGRTIVSTVEARLSGLNPGDEGRLLKAALGIRTTRKFQDAIVDASLRPKGLSHLFELFERSDSTVLVLAGRGYKLRPQSNFVNTRVNTFKPGDPIEISLEVDPVDDAKSVIVSALGSGSEFPQIDF